MAGCMPLLHAIVIDRASRQMQVNLYGAVTQAESKRLTEHAAAVAVSPTFSVQKERALLAAVGKNPYQKALLLMQMATFHVNQAERVRAARLHFL
jgi:hypothetical protein